MKRSETRDKTTDVTTKYNNGILRKWTAKVGKVLFVLKTTYIQEVL